MGGEKGKIILLHSLFLKSLGGSGDFQFFDKKPMKVFLVSKSWSCEKNCFLSITLSASLPYITRLL